MKKENENELKAVLGVLIAMRKKALKNKSHTLLIKNVDCETLIEGVAGILASENEELDYKKAFEILVKNTLTIDTYDEGYIVIINKCGDEISLPLNNDEMRCLKECLEECEKNGTR